MKKILKTLTMIAMALTLVLPMVPASATALDADYLINGGASGVDIKADTGLSDSDPRTIAAKIINIALGFLGILAVVIILIGGFKWMTAAGNEEGVEDAKKILVAGVIGLVIILASWGIANFVLTSLVTSI
jgi:Zn-dependent protease with chaperone function